MTARISLNLGRRGGHRPPLQSEHFLPLGKAKGRASALFSLTLDRFVDTGNKFWSTMALV